MPRPKILDVNEGVGEALFYPYNVLVNKCSGSCNMLDDPMSKFCVPNMIKRVNIFIGLFSVIMFAVVVFFCIFAYFKWFKGKNCLEINILIIEIIKMNIESLKIKTKTNYNWDDVVYINDFDVNLLETIKTESRIGANIYYI